jgi:hypothetical protein
MKSFCLSLFYIILFNHLSSQVSFTIASSICKADTTSITANTGTLSNTSYTWSTNPTGANFSSPNGSMTNVSFLNSGTFIVTLSVTSNSTTSTFQNTITVFTLPLITLTQNSFTTCIASNFPQYSNPVNLSATGGTTYIWNPPFFPLNGSSPNAPSNTVRPSVYSCFSVTGIDANGCKAMASVCINVIPRFSITVTPSNTTICKNNFSDIGYTAELIASNPSAPAYGSPATHSYSWTNSPSNFILTTIYSPSIICAPQINTTYTVEMLDSLHCISLPALTTVSVQNCTGIYESTLNYWDIKCFPNPVKEKLYIVTSDRNVNIHMKIINTVGVVIKECNLEKQEIDLSEFPTGIYFLKLQNGSEQKIFKFIKE